MTQGKGSLDVGKGVLIEVVREDHMAQPVAEGRVCTRSRAVGPQAEPRNGRGLGPIPGLPYQLNNPGGKIFGLRSAICHLGA